MLKNRSISVLRSDARHLGQGKSFLSPWRNQEKWAQPKNLMSLAELQNGMRQVMAKAYDSTTKYL